MADPAQKPRQPFLAVTLEDKDKPDVSGALASVEVEDNDRLADKATLVFNDRQGVSAETFRNGMKVKIDMGWSGEHAVLFEGIIHARSTSDTAGARTVQVVAYDLSTLMHRVAEPEAHVGKLKDILTKFIGKPKVNIPAGQVEPDPNPEFTKEKPLKQPNGMTDLQFIQFLALRYNARAFVEYNDGASKFYFVTEQSLWSQKPLAKLRCCGGFEKIIEFKTNRVSTNATPFRPAMVINAQDGSVFKADPPPADPPAPVTLSPEKEKAADAAGVGDAARKGAEIAAGAKTTPEDLVQQLAAAGLPSDKDLADALSKPDPTQIMGLRGEGTVVGNIHIRAKSKLTISGIASNEEGDWYVRVARHIVQNNEYQTKILVTR